MSEVVESKSYNWTSGDYNHNIICYTKGTGYNKLHITITNVATNEVTTTHKSGWKQMGDSLDVIVSGLSNNGDDANMRGWNILYYDLHAKFGIGYVFNVNSPLFARFYTDSRNKDYEGVDIEGFNVNNEIWLSCDTNTNVKIIMLELHDDGDLVYPLAYEEEYSGCWTPFVDDPGPGRAHRIIENEFHKWAYKQIKQFYLQSHGKEILAILHTFSQSLVKLIIDYVL